MGKLNDAFQNLAGKIGFGPKRSSKDRPKAIPIPDEETIAKARRRNPNAYRSGRSETIMSDGL